MKSKWDVIGRVCVDTGRLVVCDPIYADDVAGWDPIAENDTLRKKRIAGDIAVVFMTGLGDGFYPVEARRVDGYIAEVRIRFIPHPGFA